MSSQVCNLETCCVAKLIDGGGGRKAILQHYVDVLNSISQPEPSRIKEEEEVIDCSSQEVGHCEGNLPLAWGEFRTSLESVCCSGEGHDNVSNGCLKGSPVLYGGTRIKGGVNQQLYICDQSSLSNLETCLDMIMDRNCSGSISSYLYVLRQHSIFLWHVDGCRIHTKGTIGHNGNKAWFLIPSKYITLLNFMLTRRFNLHLGHALCLNVTGVKSDAKAGLQHQKLLVYMVAQDTNELTYTCHSDCSAGPKISEAVNYVQELRFPCGLSDTNGCEPYPNISSLKCYQSIQHSDRNICGVQTTTVLHSEPFDSSQEIKVEDMDLSQLVVGSKEEELLHTEKEQGPEMGRVCREGEQKDSKKSLRLLLECPACDKTYEGGKGRLERLLKHINKQHKEQEEILLKMIDDRYSQEHCRKPRKNRCPECSKQLAGNTFHLKMHLQSVHKFSHHHAIVSIRKMGR